ncbi:hypothetical protein EDD15DRAFT_2199211 [Pisolithus albus]|nr:hypothetical protein EDD15DRAFT_2199211 [Pisolithus albus]
MSINPKWPLAWKTFYEKAALDYVLLPDGVRNTLVNLTPEGRVAVDSAFFEGELSECEDTKGNQPRFYHQLANEYYKTGTKYCKAAKPPWFLSQALLPMGSTLKEQGKLQACFAWPDIGMQLGNPKGKEVVNQKFPAVKVFNDQDPLLFEGREIIFNQKSGPHVDRQDPQPAWVAPLALGEFHGGYLHWAY